MNRAVLNSLTEAEYLLVAETERAAMAELDEDALLELHARVRRARSKYVKLYRREAGPRVAELGGRGFASPKNQRNRDKAEVFELALARVSRRVGVVAGHAADDLRSERLEAARSGGSGPASGHGSAPSAKQSRRAGRRPPATKTTGGTKKDASSRAAGARRQAKRDSR